MSPTTSTSFFAKPFFLQFAEGMKAGYNNQINLAITHILANNNSTSLPSLNLRTIQIIETVGSFLEFMEKLGKPRRAPWVDFLMFIPLLLLCASKIPNNTVKKIVKNTEKYLSIGSYAVALISTIGTLAMGSAVTAVTGIVYLGLTFKVYSKRNELSETSLKVIYLVDTILCTLTNLIISDPTLRIVCSIRVLPLTALAISHLASVVEKMAKKVRCFIETMKHDFHQKPDFD